MPDQLWLLLWLSVLAVSCRFPIADRRRVAELSLLLACGHLVAAGLACGRPNPFHASSGGYTAFLQLLCCAVPLAVCCCRTTLSRGRRDLVYAAVFLLGSGFGFMRRIDAIKFSLKPADLLHGGWSVSLVFCGALALVVTLLAFHLREARRHGSLKWYLGGLLALLAALGLTTFFLRHTHYLHLHHYFWALSLVALFRYAPWWSRLPQALVLGIFVDGVASWGVERLWYPR